MLTRLAVWLHGRRRGHQVSEPTRTEADRYREGAGYFQAADYYRCHGCGWAVRG